MMSYIPCPIDTSDMQLSEDIVELTEKLSENTHAVWAAGRRAQGWTYGLVAYDELSEDKKPVTATPRWKRSNALSSSATPSKRNNSNQTSPKPPPMTESR